MDFTIPDAHCNHLRLGTCSWKYDSWKGLVYDPDTNYHADDYLVDYGKHFNTVEIDQWFWSLFPAAVKMPAPKTVSTYAASVPADFVFAVKAPNAITLTHFYARQPKQHASFANKPNQHFLSVPLLERFLESLQGLGERLGPIMFQFEYLNRKKMPSPGAFFEQLDEFFEKAPTGYQYAIETRNPAFLSESFFQFFRARGIGFVLLDSYYMPPIEQAVAKNDIHTTDFSIIRLHGGDRSEVEKITDKSWKKIVLPKPLGLKATAQVVRDNTRRGVTTYVNVNNHYEGSAPITIERFLEELRVADIPSPDCQPPRFGENQ